MWAIWAYIKSNGHFSRQGVHYFNFRINLLVKRNIEKFILVLAFANDEHDS